MVGRLSSATVVCELDLEEPEGSCAVERREEQDLGDSLRYNSAGEVQCRDGSSSGGTVVMKKQWKVQAQGQVGRTAAVFEGDLDLGLLEVLEVVGLKPNEERLAKGCSRWTSVYQTRSS